MAITTRLRCPPDNKCAIEEHLSGICELIAVPHERALADGDLVDLDVLKPKARGAFTGR